MLLSGAPNAEAEAQFTAAGGSIPVSGDDGKACMPQWRRLWSAEFNAIGRAYLPVLSAAVALANSQLPTSLGSPVLNGTTTCLAGL